VRSPGSRLERILGVVDQTSEVSGRTFAWLVIPLILGVTYEVGARYLFNAPTVWAYDLSYMLYAGIFMLGAAYTLRHGAHVRTDFLYNNFSDRRKAQMDAAWYCVFLPVLAFLILSITREAYHSWDIDERSGESPWHPPLYPLKWMMVVALSLLFLQSIAEFIRALAAARKRPTP
jgi:TRAP-type mannitol/chloroaromatic compound transport system permease small subunit